MHKLIELVLSIVILLSSFFAGYYYKSYITKPEPTTITTTGDVDKISHTAVKQTKKQTKFDTISTGEGVIHTVIQNPELPSYTVLLNYSLKGKVGVQGLYRFDNFVVGAGVTSSPDAYVSAGLMF